MAIPLSPKLARRLIADPVLAAKVTMGAELDVFQAARLRHWWFCPTVNDCSGVSVGKSELAFVWVFLRLFLLPLAFPRKPRIVTVYYQSQGTAEEVFLPKLDEYISRSKVFQDQLRMQHGRKYYREKTNVIVIETREGGWCELPAGDFMKDSQNQASKRFNDLVVDEAAKIDVLGRGIDKELLQRATRECFNPNHPVHANHQLFLGHAESPRHPYYKRYANIRREARRGSQDHCVITSSYRDFRGVFHTKFGQTAAKLAQQQYLRVLDEAEHAQTWDGLWKLGAAGLYSESLREAVLNAKARVQLRRADAETIYHLGWDTAGALTEGSDWNYGVVMAATPVSLITDFGSGVMLMENLLWFVRAVYAVALRTGDVDQKAGLIHRLHRDFGFAGLTLDSRGGGIEVYMKLRAGRQLIDNSWQQVSGLCTPRDSFAWPLAQPLVSFYDRGEPLFAPWFGEKYVTDNTGPLDFGHRNLIGLMRKREIAWPLGVDKLDPSAIAGMTQPELAALADLERALRQFGNIRVRTDKNGQPLVSDKGFQKFTHKGKKDGAMAAMYAVHGIRATLARQLSGRRPANGQTCMGVFA